MDAKVGWSEAEAAVGVDDPGADWILRPAAHADALPDRAAALRRVLQAAPVRAIMDRYRDQDDEAGRQQKRYRAARRRIMALAYATAGAGLLALSMHFVLGYQSDLQIALVAIHVLSLVWVIIDIIRLNRLDPRRKWLEARGEAELLRIALFDHVFAAHDDHYPGAEIPLLPLQLAYFRRYQLDVQLRYLQGRGRQLIRAAGFPAWFTSICLIVALVALALAIASAIHFAHEQGVAIPGFMISLIQPQLVEEIAAWAFLALVVSTVYAILTTHQNVSEDQRNGTRYLALYQNLKFLKDHGYEAARQAAEAGNRAQVLKFVELVHDRMRAEQNEWVSIQRMVEGHDQLLASSTARGLTDLFPERFHGKPQDSSMDR